jgi:hypothetical protein
MGCSRVEHPFHAVGLTAFFTIDRPSHSIGLTVLFMLDGPFHGIGFMVPLKLLTHLLTMGLLGKAMSFSFHMFDMPV